MSIIQRPEKPSPARIVSRASLIFESLYLRVIRLSNFSVPCLYKLRYLLIESIDYLVIDACHEHRPLFERWEMVVYPMLQERL